MSRKLKRVLHAVECRDGQGWILERTFLSSDGNKQADRLVKQCPTARRHVIYDRNDVTIWPGQCLWIVERYNGTEWQVERVCETLEDCRRCRAFITDRPTRELRFVRRKERNW